jgi:hypothetical protein
MQQIETEPTIKHRRPEDGKDKHFKLRNVLNILFMLGAVVGMLVYFLSTQTVGTIIILVSMLFKVAECCLRFIR